MDWVPKCHFASDGHVWSLFKGFGKFKRLIILVTNQGVKSVYWACGSSAISKSVLRNEC